jgi:hypothetical protein
VQRRSLIVRSIWAACLLLAGANHARILLQYGLFWDYGGAGWMSAAYWTSLTLLDPLAAFLLFTRPKVGIIGTVALIAANVLHNLAVTAQRGGGFLADALHPMVLSQIGFLLLVAATARVAWAAAEPCVADCVPPAEFDRNVGC